MLPFPPGSLGRKLQGGDTLVAMAGQGLLVHGTGKHAAQCFPNENLQILDLKLPSFALPCLSANSHWDKTGFGRAKDAGAVPRELNIQKKCFMWLYVSFNFLVENAVNL